MTDGHNAYLVAQYLLRRAGSLSPLQINKFVFFSHAWYLGVYKHPLIYEPVEAWKYGPVISSIYHAFKHCGPNKVRPSPDKLYQYDGFNECEVDIMNQVVDVYGGYTGGELIGITHRQDSPWSKHYKPGELSTIIPNGVIEQHYSERYRRLEKEGHSH